MAENELPQFFKVFLSETASESMSIPLSFLEHLHHPLPNTVTLQGNGGGIWTVGLSKIRGQGYFTEGWSKFAEEHDLKDGEFLTFVYNGHRTFEVSVYGRSGCKETRAVALMVELSDSGSEPEPESESGDESVVVVDDDDEDHEVSQSIYPVDSDETETDVAVRNSNTEITKNPSFVTCLKNRTYELLIPANVVKTYDLKFGQWIKYIDGEGNLEGEKGKWADDRICFKGWDRICRRNRLKEQDTVVCELLHTQRQVHSIRIHIKRGGS